MSSIINLSDSNNECYEASLAKKRAKAEVLLREQEQKEWLERQAQKEVKIAERKRLEEELRRKQEEDEVRQREEQCQRDLAHCLEANRVMTWRKRLSHYLYFFFFSFLFILDLLHRRKCRKVSCHKCHTVTVT